MATKIYSKYLDKVTDQERRQLNHLVLRRDSLMREDVLQRKTYLRDVRVFLLKDQETKKILAWSAVLLPSRYKYSPVRRPSLYAYVYTYVMRAHRRKGYGKRLLNSASKWIRNSTPLMPKVIAWDTRSLTFFKSVKREGTKLNIRHDFYTFPNGVEVSVA